MIRKLLLHEFAQANSMIGELLNEIAEASGQKFTDYDSDSALRLLEEGVRSERMWVFVASDTASLIGLVCLSESYAVYAGGQFGVITELYVREAGRSRGLGELLIQRAVDFAHEKGWPRLEVTTPPLPAFSRSLEFYEKNNFQITGGRKLKRSIGEM